MSQAQATARTVWFSITTATEDPPGLPVPTGVNLDDRANPPIAGLTFNTANDAQTWAIWVEHDHTASWSPTGTVTFIGHRMGWSWLLSCHVPNERSGSSSSRVIDGSDRLLVPCGRCGHDQDIHTGTEWVGDCPSCPDGRCQPVLVRVGGATTTIVDAEDEVE